jgi:copper chaperone CopZ
MGKITLDVPALWADHHVLRVRDVLVPMEGVEEVYASSAWKQVLVGYDEAKTDQSTIEAALAEAGYPVGGDGVSELVKPGESQRDPQWEVLGARSTVTNQVDLEMSGDFRRY